MTENREQFDNELPDRWIERQLRRIPLPAGLLRRLRMIAEADDTLAVTPPTLDEMLISDAALDASLRNVGLPRGMQTRLLRIPRNALSEELDDAQLDAMLGDVPLPSGMADRLTSIADEDEQLADQLGDIPIPHGMLDRLSQIPEEIAVADSEATKPKYRNSVSDRRRHQRTTMSWQWATGMAMSIALLISLVYFGSDYLRPPVATDPRTETPPSIAQDFVTPDNDTPRDETAIAHSKDDESGTPHIPDLQPADFDSDWDVVKDDVFAPPFSPELILDPANPNGSVEPVDSARLLARDPGQVYPALAVIKPPKWHGIQPPLVDAAALTTQMGTGFHPFVSPSRHAALQTRRLPLHTGRESFDWFAATLPQQRLQSKQFNAWRKHLAEHVRTEDFINAVDYHYPLPTDRAVALRAYGGTSPFSGGFAGNNQVQLLQLGIQAAAPPAQLRSPTHLIVLVDTSASMTRNHRLIEVQRALARLWGSLEPLDRVSLVATSYQAGDAQAIIENLGSDETQRWQEAVASLRASSNQDMTTALRIGNDLAKNTPVGLNGRPSIVWFTDGADGSDEATDSWQADVSQMLANLRKTNEQEAPIDLHIVTLSGDSKLEESETLDHLEAMFSTSPQVHLVANDTEDTYWAARRALTGRSHIVARDVEVEITFDPNSVASYRLYGHEATTIVGHQGGSLRIDMHAGQSATVLFELQLKPSGGETVATAKLNWRDPHNDTTREQLQRISRWQFVSSFEESALPLQSATIAVAAAESLRQSVHTSPAGMPISAVRRQVLDVSPLVAEDDSFLRLMRLLQRAEEVGL